MFDQLPHDRGDEPFRQPVSRLLFMAVIDDKTSTSKGSHTILHHLGDHPALPYGVVETAMKAVSHVDVSARDLASLHRSLGAAMEKVGLLSTSQSPSLSSSYDGGTARENVLVQEMLGGICKVPLARWKVGRA